MIKLVIFESSNLLIDTSNSSASVLVSDFLKRIGIVLTPRVCAAELDASRDFVVSNFGFDSSIHDFERLALSHFLEKQRVRLSVVDFENLLRSFHDAQVEHAKLFDDVAPLLKWFKGKAKLCLVAEGPSWRERKLISKVGISDLFSARVYSEELGVNKSTESFFSYILEKFGVKAQQVVLITSNTDRDVTSANRLGICTVLVDRAEKYKLADLSIRPKFLVHSLKDISKLPL